MKLIVKQVSMMIENITAVLSHDIHFDELKKL